MSKDLETLKNNYMKMLLATNTPLSMEETLLFENIEQELKEREMWRNLRNILENTNHELARENEKLKKVVGIIKNKRVNLDFLRSCKSLDDYNNILIQKWQLTQEEYDLLKEVLL